MPTTGCTCSRSSGAEDRTDAHCPSSVQPAALLRQVGVAGVVPAKLCWVDRKTVWRLRVGNSVPAENRAVEI